MSQQGAFQSIHLTLTLVSVCLAEVALAGATYVVAWPRTTSPTELGDFNPVF